MMRIPRQALRQDLLSTAHSLGLRHFDVAPIYGFGKAEAELGCFIRSGASDISVVSKFGRALTASGRMLSRVQRPARAILRRLPALKDGYRKSSGGVAVPPAPTRDEFLRGLDATVDALGGHSLSAYLSHEFPATRAWVDLLRSVQTDIADLPTRSLGYSGSWQMVRTFVETEAVTSPMLQLPIDDAQAAGDRPVNLYSTVSTLRERMNARLATSPDLLARWGVAGFDDVTPVLVASALRMYPKSRVVIGTTSKHRLEAVVRFLERDQSVFDWSLIIRDLYQDGAPGLDGRFVK